MLVVVGVVLGAVTGIFAGAAERGLYATGLWQRGGASTVAPGTFDAPATPATPSARPASPSPTGLPAPVLPAASTGRAASAARVAARVEAVDEAGMGGSFSAQVADLTRGRVLYSHRAGTPAIPASTNKLLTATAALSLLGGEHTFSTSVVRAGGTVVLVGGGDPYLTRKRSGSAGRASLEQLAADTAAELRRTRTTTVALGYDASLFSGPAWNPRWPGTYADQVTPVSALWVERGRTRGVSPGPRVADPARDAARAFARALEKQGLVVTRTAPAKRPAAGVPVAGASSMPLEQIVERLLLASDNDTSEVLLRHVALADDRPGSSAEGIRAVRRELDRLGVWADDARLQDGSGLARQTRVPARTLVGVLRLAAEPDHPELRGILTGLPVAGVEGSLGSRFGDEQSRSGRGLVRGKTGTLTGVHALAGYLRTKDQQLVAYAFLVNDAKNDYEAKVWLDRVSAALSRCGC
jgi:D-alanyl-D-alanine carboxypeptidase/D-alanyl-D-alanine-endopeptidase (penicillin-binding protein 4)